MKRNYLYNLLLSLANVLFPIISFPYAAHILGPSGIGKVQFAFSFAQYFALFAALGIPIYGISEIARAKGDPDRLSRSFSELVVIYFTTSLFFTLIYLTAVFFIPWFRADQTLYLYAGMIILFGFSAIDWFYSGVEEFRTLAVRSVIIKTLSLFFLFLFVTDVSDYAVYLLIMVFSFLGNNMISLFLVGRHTRLCFSGLNLRRHLRPLFFIFSTTIAASMYTVLDTVLLGFLTDDATVGFYTAAIKLTKITLPLITSFGMILIPRIAKETSEGNIGGVQELIEKSFHFIVFFSVPIVAGSMMLAPEFIAIFSGAEFLPATTAMRILSFLPFLIGFGHLFAFQILITAGKNKEMFFSVTAGMIVCMVLNFALIPVLKERGAAIANVCTELAVTSFYFYYVRKHFSFKYDLSILFKSIACSVIFIPIIAGVQLLNVSQLVKVIVSVSICPLIYAGAQWLIFRDHFIIEVLGDIRSRFRAQTAS